MPNKSYLTDIAVALIFFNRPDCLRATFSAIAQSRPSTLFLIQDGAREEREDDRINIQKCRDIVKNIDWDCTVYTDYSDTNLGCGMRVYSGINKAFQIVDKIAIIEDDIVISPDFLPFCKTMLDHYEYDERIGMISGMNHIGTYKECPYSYFFSSQGGAIWGWATWKRVWEQMEWDLSCYNDKYALKIFPLTVRPISDGNALIKILKEKYSSYLKKKKQTSWSFQFGFTSCYLQSRLNIIPVCNLIQNIGFSGDSVHSSGAIYYVPRGLRCVYSAPTYPLSVPYKHPRYVINDLYYAKMQRKIMGGGVIRHFSRRIETLLYRIFPFLGKL